MLFSPFSTAYWRLLPVRKAASPWSGLTSSRGGELARRLQLRDTMAGNKDEMRGLLLLEVSLLESVMGFCELDRDLRGAAR